MNSSGCGFWLLVLLAAAEAFLAPPPEGMMTTSYYSRRPRPQTTTRTSRLAAFESGALAALDSFYQTQPYLSAFLTCCVKAGAADLVAQSSEGRQREEEEGADAADAVPTTPAQHAVVDLPRSLAFVCYGGLYQGLFQQYLYTELFPSWISSSLPPDAPVAAGVAFQVAVDMSLIGPFLCLPVAYATKGAFAPSGKPNEAAAADGEEGFGEAIRRGLERYVRDCRDRGLLHKFWAVWVPVQFLVFGAVPSHLRIAAIAAVSFFWVVVLSSTAAEREEAATPSRQKRRRDPAAATA